MNLDDLLKSIREEDDSKGGKDLDDLLESIKNDSNGKKIDTNKFLKRKTFENPLKGQRFTAPEIIQTRLTTSKVNTDKIIPKDAVIGEEIAEKLDELIKVIREDNKLEEESQKEDKKQLATKKRKDREDRIESKKETKFFIINLKESTGKVSGFFDNLKNFLTKVLLSGLINTLYNFFTDPKNKEKIKAIQGFLKDWWPALAAGIAFILTPFKGLILNSIGFLASTTSKILKLFTTNPIFSIAVAAGVVGVMDYLKGKQRSRKLREEVTELMEKEDISETEARKRLIEQKEEEARNMPYSMNPFDDTRRELLKEAEQLKNINFERSSYGFNLSGDAVNRAPGFEKELTVDQELFINPGTGAGQVPSLKAFSGGGLNMGTDTVPAMLSPGEFVMSRGAVNMFGADTLIAMNKAGGGTNRPKYGKVRGYQGGGYVGFAKKMVQEHEGYNIVDGMHQAYRDNKGLPTIGYGHLITPGDGYSMSSKISQQEADKLFDKDFQFHSEHAQKIPGFKKASDKQKAALIDLTFNMGPAWHKDFPGFVKAFSAGDYETAANEIRYKDVESPNLQDSDYYKDVGPRRANPIISLIRNQGIENSPHLKGFEKLLPVSKSTDGMKPSTPSVSTTPGSLGPAFSDDTSMKDLSKQQLVRDRLNSIGSKLSNPIDTFIRTPLKRAFPGTPNVPTETRNFVLPPTESKKQNQSKNQTGDIPSFSVVSGNMMRDLIAKDLGISDLAGVS